MNKQLNHRLVHRRLRQWFFEPCRLRRTSTGHAMWLDEAFPTRAAAQLNADIAREALAVPRYNRCRVRISRGGGGWHVIVSVPA